MVLVSKWNPVEAAHKSIPMLRGWAATAPAEAGATGTTHVITAVVFLPPNTTARTGPDLDLGLQVGELSHHLAVVVEGFDVPTGGGVVLAETAGSTVGVVTDTGNTALVTLVSPVLATRSHLDPGV